MTARKPLEWYETSPGWLMPGCLLCHDYMQTPGLLEACASVGIEHGKSTDQLLRETVDAYHIARHVSSTESQP